MAGSRGIPDYVIQEPHSARAAPPPYRAAGPGPPPPVGPQQPPVPSYVHLLPLQPSADSGSGLIQSQPLHDDVFWYLRMTRTGTC